MRYTANAYRPCSLHLNNCRGHIHTNFGEWRSCSWVTWWPWPDEPSSMYSVPCRAFSLWLYPVTKALSTRWWTQHYYLTLFSYEGNEALWNCVGGHWQSVTAVRDKATAKQCYSVHVLCNLDQCSSVHSLRYFNPSGWRAKIIKQTITTTIKNTKN